MKFKTALIPVLILLCILFLLLSMQDKVDDWVYEQHPVEFVDDIDSSD